MRLGRSWAAVGAAWLAACGGGQGERAAAPPQPPAAAAPARAPAAAEEGVEAAEATGLRLLLETTWPCPTAARPCGAGRGRGTCGHGYLHGGDTPSRCAVAGVRVPGRGTSELVDFGHSCDTLTGSSGAPVLDLAGRRVLGRHHLGVRPATGVLVNSAVPLRRILEDLAPEVRAELESPS